MGASGEGPFGARAGGLTGVAFANPSCLALSSRFTGGLASGELRIGVELNAEPNGFAGGLPRPMDIGAGDAIDLAGADTGGSGEPGGVALWAWDRPAEPAPVSGVELGSCGSGFGGNPKSPPGLGTGILDGCSLAGLEPSDEGLDDLGLGGGDERSKPKVLFA